MRTETIPYEKVLLTEVSLHCVTQLIRLHAAFPLVPDLRSVFSHSLLFNLARFHPGRGLSWLFPQLSSHVLLPVG